MHIALDYDGTYTEDPVLWDNFIASAKRRGHEVTFVTMRREDEPLDPVPASIIYTSRAAKKAFTEGLGIFFDVWIDDNPHWLFVDG